MAKKIDIGYRLRPGRFTHRIYELEGQFIGIIHDGWKGRWYHTTPCTTKDEAKNRIKSIEKHFKKGQYCGSEVSFNGDLSTISLL